jgi:mRNA export factor
MAVVGTAGRGLIVYQLEGKPQEYKRIESPLKYQHRCVAIFRDKKKSPTGYALGSVEGRVAIQYVNPQNPKDNFTFKCHRSNGAPNGYQDIYAVSIVCPNVLNYLSLFSIYSVSYCEAARIQQTVSL